AAFANDRTRFEKQVHHHRLAAADIAEHVETFGGVFVVPVAEPTPARRAVRDDALLQPAESRQQALLSPIALKFPCSDQAFVEFESGHRWACVNAGLVEPPRIG